MQNVESIFGTLSVKFRVFLKLISLHPNKVKVDILAYAYVNIFVHRNVTSRNFYLAPSTFDLGHLTIMHSSHNLGDQKMRVNVLRRSEYVAQNIGTVFLEYFISTEGSISWQYTYA
jgi:hypothetical protein